MEDHSLAGPTLVFVTLPEVFARMGNAPLWSGLFFLLLTVAALTSTISIAEVSVKFIQDRFSMSRIKSCLIVILPLFVLSALCSLSQGSLSHVTIFGLNIFDFLDNLTSNIMLPAGSLLLCIYMGWYAPKNLLISELGNYGTIQSRMPALIRFIIRYLAPVLIACVLITPLL